jgi:hypothetical protein
MTATLIKADGTSTKVTPENGESFSLAELQSFVGGYIKIISLPNGNLMILSDEGKLIGLPINATASDEAVGAGLMPGYTIVGDVLVTPAKYIE